jgi:hypothetical protein
MTTVALAPGAVYTFQVEARNSVGYSLPSSTVSILCAQPPDQPEAPVTQEMTSNIIITWNLPWDGGSEILSYIIVIQHKDGTSYSEDTVNCNGSEAQKIAMRTCTLTSLSLTEAPYMLEWGDSVYAKVLATNVKGSSTYSLQGNGGIILRVPDIPDNLRDMPDVTNAY